MNTERHVDVAIVGGAIMGCSVAYFLKLLDPAMDVCVIEPDPTYKLASTLRASGGARRLFSCPENIEMSHFSIDFIKRCPEQLALNGEPAFVDWREEGYLFIVTPQGMPTLEANFELQQTHGVDAYLLDRAELKSRFQSMFVGDLGGGVHSPRDGWCDPNGLLQSLRKKARSLCVEYIKDEVIGFGHTKSVVTDASLASGQTVKATVFVNATGAWAEKICEMVGMPLPVKPMRRFEHYFSTRADIEPLPYVKDLDRLAFRPEGEGYSGGLVDSDGMREFDFDLDNDYFEAAVWPALAHRFPAFEATKCHRTWSGLYDQCEFDGNPIIGNWKGRLDNFYVITGFSGHGMMHAPAAGRGIAELVVHKRFETLDLSRFAYGRIARNEPYPERGIL